MQTKRCHIFFCLPNLKESIFIIKNEIQYPVFSFVCWSDKCTFIRNLVFRYSRICNEMFAHKEIQSQNSIVEGKQIKTKKETMAAKNH